MRILFSLLIVLVLFVSCDTSENQEDTPLENMQSAAWIASSQTMPAHDSLLYGDLPAPLFRKEFVLKSQPENAYLLITAAGYYTVWVNGQKLGDQELSPAWTDYTKRIYFREYPLDELLQQGENVISVELGNGWYNPLPLRMWGHANLRERLSIGKPCFVADLEFGTKNQTVSSLQTDSSWKWFPGPVLRNNIYLGEVHNVNLEPQGWKLPGFNDQDWLMVEVLPGPGGELVHADFPPIRKTATCVPKSIWKTQQGSLMVDFGQNMAGWIRYEGPSNALDSIVFRFGERIWSDSTLNPMTAVCGQIKRAGVGGPGAPDIAEQRDIYISDGVNQLFEPRYSFHGFRYVEISGLELIDLESLKNQIKAYRLGSDVAKIADLEFDLEWMNQIQTMVEWTLTSNIFSVPSDCPAREKFGYGGDITQNAEAFLYNYDMDKLLRKFILDWKDAMRDDRFVDTAPYVGINYCGISWEISFLSLQYWLYRFYGDLDFVSQWYDFNLSWMNKVDKLLGLDLVRKGLSDHESLLPVPVELTGTGHLYQGLRIMENFSQLLDRKEEEALFKSKADSVQRIMVDSLWLHPVKNIENPQTWYSTLLFHEVLSPAQEQEALKLLLDDLESRNFALTTGIFGTPYLLEVLSKKGHVQEVYDMISRKDFPGWRFMIENGATTLWETWKESDNTFSQNHPMFAAVSTWYYRWLGGLAPKSAGFEEIVLQPCPVVGLKQFSMNRELPGGHFELNWVQEADQLVFELELPSNCIATWKPAIPEGYSLSLIRYPGGDEQTPNTDPILLNQAGRYFVYYTH